MDSIDNAWTMAFRKLRRGEAEVTAFTNRQPLRARERARRGSICEALTRVEWHEFSPPMGHHHAEGVKSLLPFTLKRVVNDDFSIYSGEKKILI